MEATLLTLNTLRRVDVIDAVEGVVRGYVFIWGSSEHRDSYDTWFDKSRPPSYSFDGDLRGYPICYEHGQDAVYGKAPVGVITRTYLDDTGLAFEGKLDRSHPQFERTVSELQRRELATSSSSAAHVATFRDDGSFENWLMTELSFTSSPAEHAIPAVEVVRSDAEVIQDGLRADVPDTAQTQPQGNEASNMDINALLQQLAASGMDAQTLVQALIQAGYLPEEIAAACGQGQQQPMMDSANAAPVEPPRSENYVNQIMEVLNTMRSEAEQKAQDEVIVAMRAELDALKAEQIAARNAPPVETEVRHAPTASGVDVSVSEPVKYWGRSFQDLAFGQMVLRNKGIQVSDEYKRVMAARAADLVKHEDGVFSDPAVRSSIPFSALRANEVSISTASGAGDEWVSIAWSSDLWEKARNNRIIDQIISKGMRVEEVPQGAESVYVLTEGADPTVYTIAQNADATSGRPTPNVAMTRPGTGRVLLTPGELGMAVAFSDVYEEDSIIRVSSQYQTQMQMKAEETIEQLFINGDTATGATTNINLIDGTPGTGTSTPYYIASDGALKYALVTGSSTSSAGSSLTENDYRLALKLFGSAVRSRKPQLAFIIDPDTHNTSLDIAAIKTDDVKSSNATITAGVVTKLYGVDVFESGFMPLANSAGKVPAAGGTLGRILGVYAPFWAMGWKRRITVETDRDILSGVNIIVAKMRLGFAARGSDAAIARYNLTIA